MSILRTLTDVLPHKGSAAAALPTTKLLTFQTWVTDARWYDCTVTHPELVPYPLVDRSPCQDPSFDPFADAGHRRPVITGLCRGRAMKKLTVGDRFIYITRITGGLHGELGLASWP